MTRHAVAPAPAVEVALPELIPSLVAGVSSTRASVRFGSAKALSLLAAGRPELLYPHFDFFVKQLDCPNSILRWNATRTLACLAPADRRNKLETALDKYLSPIPGPQMIAAATAIRWASTIALAKPHLADRLARAILGVRRAAYETEECRNVAIGHAIQSLGRFFEFIEDKKAVVKFVRAQLDNSRPATRAKARTFLTKHSGAGLPACLLHTTGPQQVRRQADPQTAWVPRPAPPCRLL